MEKPRKPGTFIKGHKVKPPVRNGPNIITRQIKAGIVDAAVSLGSDGKGTDGLNGYLKFCARKHPKHFMVLIQKLMPRNGISAEAAKVVSDMIAPPPPPQPLTAMEKFRRARGLPP